MVELKAIERRNSVGGGVGRCHKKIGTQTKCITNYNQSKSPNLVLAIFSFRMMLSTVNVHRLRVGVLGIGNGEVRKCAGVDGCGEFAKLCERRVEEVKLKFVHNYNY